jgi:hypothetical protein
MPSSTQPGGIGRLAVEFEVKAFKATPPAT